MIIKLDQEIANEFAGDLIRSGFSFKFGKFEINDKVIAEVREDWWVNSMGDRQITEYSNGVKHGSIIRRYRNGVISEKQFYKHGKKNGPVLGYSPHGILKWTEEWKNGCRDGKSINYYNSGIIDQSITYKNGKQNGQFIKNDKDGNPLIQGQYTNGQRTGSWTFYKNRTFIIKNYD